MPEGRKVKMVCDVPHMCQFILSRPAFHCNSNLSKNIQFEIVFSIFQKTCNKANDQSPMIIFQKDCAFLSRINAISKVSGQQNSSILLFSVTFWIFWSILGAYRFLIFFLSIQQVDLEKCEHLSLVICHLSLYKPTKKKKKHVFFNNNMNLSCLTVNYTSLSCQKLHVFLSI